MKHDYTEEEYRSLQNIGQAEDPGPSYKKTANRTESEHPKRFSEEAAGRKHAALLVFAVIFMLLVMCGIVAAVSVSLKNNRMKRENTAREANVLTIDGESVGADVFRLFCVNVIEGEEFEAMMRNALNDSVLAENVKAKAAAYLTDYICLSHEAQKAGMTLSAGEMNDLRKSCEQAAAASGVSAESYYLTNYGVSFETYVRIRANWMLVGKYAALLREQCDLSEDALRAVYETNYVRFAEADVTMVYFDTSSSDEGTNGFKRSNAEAVYNEICSLSEEGIMTADDIALTAAVREWSDPNRFFETGSSASGQALVTGTASARFPVLFETVITMHEGEVRLVKDDAAVFIVRCDARRLFDACKDSDELKTLAQEQYILTVYEQARNSGRYEAELAAVYYDIDISQYVTEGKQYYGR